jgi:hypothetical protein
MIEETTFPMFRYTDPKPGDVLSFTETNDGLPEVIHYQEGKPVAGIYSHPTQYGVAVVTYGNIRYGPVKYDVPLFTPVYVNKRGRLTPVKKEGRPYIGKTVSRRDAEGFIHIGLA